MASQQLTSYWDSYWGTPDPTDPKNPAADPNAPLFDPSQQQLGNPDTVTASQQVLGGGSIVGAQFPQFQIESALGGFSNRAGGGSSSRRGTPGIGGGGEGGGSSGTVTNAGPDKGSYTESSWAAKVLTDLGAPVNQQNLDNMLRWMTAEEPTSNWFDRNNPLNTGVGTGGGSGLGSAPDLTAGAFDTAQTIAQANMSPIYQALMHSADPTTFAGAVMGSPWAESHYATNPINRIPVPGGHATLPPQLAPPPPSMYPDTNPYISRARQQ